MKRFLRDIGLFIVMIAMLAVGLDLMVSFGLRQTTIRKYAAWNDIYNGNNLDNDLVFLGASECWTSCNTYIIDSVLHISSYNLGIDGHPWGPFPLLRYNTYIRYTHQPRVIVITLDMGTLDKSDQPYEREQFFPYRWTDDSLISAIRESMELTILDRYCPMWRHVGYREEIEHGIASFFGKQGFEDDGVYKGYRGNTIAWSRASLNSMDSIETKCDREVADDLIQFAKQRKAEGQIVVFVKPPLYSELQDRFTNKRQLSKLFDSIAAEVDAPLLDYWDLEVVMDSSYFYNPSHLNKKGSEQMSIRLAYDLDSLDIIK